jgi:hypothetical protein
MALGGTQGTRQRRLCLRSPTANLKLSLHHCTRNPSCCHEQRSRSQF